MDSCAGQDPRVFQLSDLSQYHSDTLILAAKVDDFYNKLSASEQKCVSKAVDSRRREFSTGRWLAHNGLVRFGILNAEILPDNHRQPIWPDGIVGSITHTRDHAIVALAHRLNYRSVGIDMERKFRVESALASKILTERERSEHSEVDPTLVFSAKEAVHKLIFPIIERYIDFIDVEIKFDHSTGTFYPRFLLNIGDAIDLNYIRGKYISFRYHWVSYISFRTDITISSRIGLYKN